MVKVYSQRNICSCSDVIFFFLQVQLMDSKSKVYVTKSNRNPRIRYCSIEHCEYRHGIPPNGKKVLLFRYCFCSNRTIFVVIFAVSQNVWNFFCISVYRIQFIMQHFEQNGSKIFDHINISKTVIIGFGSVSFISIRKIFYAAIHRLYCWKILFQRFFPRTKCKWTFEIHSVGSIVRLVFFLPICSPTDDPLDCWPKPNEQRWEYLCAILLLDEW